MAYVMFDAENKIKFVTVKHVPNCTAVQLINSPNKAIRLYGRDEFIVRIILMDMEFEKLADKLKIRK